MESKQHRRLHQNEMPWEPPQPVAAAAAAATSQAHLYPSWDSLELRTALAEIHHVDPGWVVVGNGSIGIIQQAMIAAGPGVLMLPRPSFEAFEPLGRALRMEIEHSPVRADGSCDLDDMASRISASTRIVVICSPNTPTGGIVGHDDLARFVSDLPAGVMVVVDEAYGEFVTDPGAARGLDLTRAHPDIVVTRTFSKAYGLAGFRVGYGIGQPELAVRIRRAGPPFVLSRPAEAAALQALGHRGEMQRRVANIRVEKVRLAAGLEELGVRVVRGHGNFLWLPDIVDAGPVAARFAAAGVLVKAYLPRGLRVTVGNRSDTELTLSIWQAVVASPARATAHLRPVDGGTGEGPVDDDETARGAVSA